MSSTLRTAQANLGLDPCYDADADITEAQAAKLKALCKETGEPFDSNLTQKQALNRIAALQEVADS